ncbi:glycosyltransferase family 4 protein [Candidatus Woesearchaeota archaeon]|nr:glycosyltransferase family 4 protein [Candidatus Woesearchaeota archaeon]
MKIAQIAPLVERIPPKKYGGTERVVHALTEELVKRGHDVTLFASGDSKTSAKLAAVYPRALREANVEDVYGSNTWTLLNIGSAYARQDEFDIIHDHNGFLSLPVAHMAHTPAILTCHGPFTKETRKLFQAFKRPYISTISYSQAQQLPDANHIGTVYNGIHFNDFTFSQEHDGYLLFVGRISMEKGTHIAIDIAQYLNKPLIIAAKLDRHDIPYYRQYIRHRLTEDIRWIGEVDQQKRNELMSRALCLLHPATWKEPFGLTMIEAMACGCPVIAFNRGSVPELIADRKTGFVVSDVDDMTDAVLSMDTIDRNACREHALQNFNALRMADGYEALYKKVLGRNGL